MHSNFSYLQDNGNFSSNGLDTVPEDASFVARILGEGSVETHIAQKIVTGINL